MEISLMSNDQLRKVRHRFGLHLGHGVDLCRPDRTGATLFTMGLAVGILILLAFCMPLQCAAQSPPSFTDAKQALNNGDYKRAETELRAILLTQPNSPEILDDLGIALQLQDESDEAIKIFERVLKLKRFPDTIALLAADYCRNHDFDRALPLLNEAKAFLGDPKIAENLGSCYLEADQPEAAVFAYEKLVELAAPPEDENAVNLLRAHFDLSRKALESLASLPQGLIYVRAIEAAKSDGSLDASTLFQKAYGDAPYLTQEMSLDELINLLATHPNDPSLLYLLGVKSAEQAGAEFDRAKDRWPDSLALSQLTAELKDSQGDRDGAIQQYEQILAAHPDAPGSVHFALGLLYAERRRWQDALQQYASAKSESIGSLYLKQRMSEALLHLEEYRSVMDLLSKIAANASAPFWALRDFGEAAEGMGQEQTAITYLKRASLLDPGDALIHYHLLRVYHKLNQPKAAEVELASYKRLLQQGSSNGSLQKPHLQQAAKFEQLHQVKNAEAEWRAALAIDPDSPVALDGLSQNLNQQGDYQETISLLEDPRLAGQRTPAQIVNLGLAYARTGKLDDSAKILQDGLNSAPDSIQLANELAEALIQLHRSDDAATVLELALTKHPDDLGTKLHYLRSLMETNSGKAAELGASLLRTYPRNWEVLYLNGVLQERSGRLRQARENLELSTRLNSDFAESHAALGYVLVQLTDMPRAKAELEKAIALGDKEEAVEQTLSKVLTSLGERNAEK
jgi:tetratricopeptide (TPR) repeat protein